MTTLPCLFTRTFVRDSLVALFPERKEPPASNDSNGKGQGFQWILGEIYVDVSKNSGVFPQIIHLNRVFPHKPSILGYPYFWKHPF